MLTPEERTKLANVAKDHNAQVNAHWSNWLGQTITILAAILGLIAGLSSPAENQSEFVKVLYLMIFPTLGVSLLMGSYLLRYQESAATRARDRLLEILENPGDITIEQINAEKSHPGFLHMICFQLYPWFLGCSIILVVLYGMAKSL